MKIGEVCLLTGNVPRLAGFYRTLLGVVSGQDSADEVHQFILTEETMLTIYNDGTARPQNSQNIQLAFTVADVDAEYLWLKALGVPIIEPPTTRPWGARNVTFTDPDGNRVTFRSLPKPE